ncbi:MAG: hypothetical protein MRY21_06825 [Simkaniaceae bacterium]|nr:hypothetical protein [Simkaniaceae bacterium]
MNSLPTTPPRPPDRTKPAAGAGHSPTPLDRLMTKVGQAIRRMDGNVYQAIHPGYWPRNQPDSWTPQDCVIFSYFVLPDAFEKWFKTLSTDQIKMTLQAFRCAGMKSSIFGATFRNMQHPAYIHYVKGCVETLPAGEDFSFHELRLIVRCAPIESVKYLITTLEESDRFHHYEHFFLAELFSRKDFNAVVDVVMERLELFFPDVDLAQVFLRIPPGIFFRKFAEIGETHNLYWIYHELNTVADELHEEIVRDGFKFGGTSPWLIEALRLGMSGSIPTHHYPVPGYPLSHQIPRDPVKLANFISCIGKKFPVELLGYLFALRPKIMKAPLVGAAFLKYTDHFPAYFKNLDWASKNQLKQFLVDKDWATPVKKQKLLSEIVRDHDIRLPLPTLEKLPCSEYQRAKNSEKLAAYISWVGSHLSTTLLNKLVSKYTALIGKSCVALAVLEYTEIFAEYFELFEETSKRLLLEFFVDTDWQDPEERGEMLSKLASCIGQELPHLVDVEGSLIEGKVPTEFGEFPRYISRVGNRFNDRSLEYLFANRREFMNRLDIAKEFLKFTNVFELYYSKLESSVIEEVNKFLIEGNWAKPSIKIRLLKKLGLDFIAAALEPYDPGEVAEIPSSPPVEFNIKEGVVRVYFVYPGKV